MFKVIALFNYCLLFFYAGSNDCGLFSIAYATTLAHGGEPERLTYNQKIIRKHLYHSFKNGKKTPFLSKQSTEISASAIFKIEILVIAECQS